MDLNLSHALTSSRILLTCGTGGVGKTTSAMALGLAAANLGRKTLVLTIDPARRLANAIGLEAFDHDIHPVGDLLDCMMLDAKRTFDRIIERYASPETAETMFTNQLYQQLSTTIAGSQEYMAMEQLYELTQSTAYDLIILDTPPTHQALDFFRAPQRLISAVTGSMLKLFAKPSMKAGRLGAQVIRLFGRVTGTEMLQEISDLILSSVSLFDGFRDRAEAVEAMLKQSTSGIILVTVPQEDQINDARHFIAELKSLNLKLHGVILNRSTPDFGDTAVSPTADADQPMAQALHALAARCRVQRTEEQSHIKTLQRTVRRKIPYIRIAERAHEITNVEDLQEMAATLLSS